jgi:hypothetical protein
MALVAVVLAACQASSGSSGVSVVDDAALSAYLQSITDEVSGNSTYHVVVYDADFAQAFALPRDEIALTLGLLAFIHNEAELACVLGHEIAHHRLGDVSDFFGGEASPPIDAAPACLDIAFSNAISRAPTSCRRAGSTSPEWWPTRRTMESSRWRGTFIPEPQMFNVGGATSVALESLGMGAGLISVPGDEDIYRIDGSAGTTLSLNVLEIDRRIFFGHFLAFGRG